LIIYLITENFSTIISPCLRRLMIIFPSFIIDILLLASPFTYALFKYNFRLAGPTSQNGRRNWIWNWSLLIMQGVAYPWQFWLWPMTSSFSCRNVLLKRNDLEIKMEKAKQNISLHITFFVFRFLVCMFESPSFSPYCMFQGEKISSWVTREDLSFYLKKRGWWKSSWSDRRMQLLKLYHSMRRQIH